jgi:SAM-dependent methyltransferase
VNVFGTYSRYYDLLYRDKEYAAEARFVRDLLRRNAAGAANLLELGCGTGRHAERLAAEGYRVHGVDSSGEMLGAANARRSALQGVSATHLEFTLGDIRTIRLPVRFDAVVALFHVVSYQTGDNDLSAAFDTARAHLRAGGLFLFDCWFGPAVLSEGPSIRIKRLEDDRISVVRIAEPEMCPDEDVVEVRYEVFITDKHSGNIETLREVHRMRYLFRPATEAMLAASGFATIECGEWMTGREPGENTWGVYFLCRATD